MELVVQPWHWVVLGIALIVFEIFLPSFTALWFGVAACIVALLVWIFPALPIEAQIIVWIILAVIFIVVWFKFIKPLAVDKTQAGIPREAILGQVGIVTATPVLDHTGVVRFSMPILGSDEWACRSHEVLTVGDRVTVMDISGNDLVVRKLRAD